MNAAISPEETVLVIDEANRVTGLASRSRMRAEQLGHRTTYVFVFASDGRLLVQRRTDTKDVYPGYHDLAAGGVLVVGETYDESAAREAEEELGVVGVRLRAHFDLMHRDGSMFTWGRVYTCVHDGPYRLQPEEVAAAELAAIDDVLDGRFDPLTPDTVAAFTELRRRGALPG